MPKFTFGCWCVVGPSFLKMTRILVGVSWGAGGWRHSGVGTGGD